MNRIFEILSEKRIAGETVFDMILDGVVIADSSKQFLYWNKAAKDILSDGPDDTDPSGWATRYKLFKIGTGNYLTYDELPMVKALNGEEFYDYRVLCKNSRNPEGIIVSVNGNPIRSGEATVGGITTFRDITEQVKLENLLNSERNLYRSILDMLPGIVFIKDLEGNYIYGNQGFHTLLKTNNILGKKTSDYLNREMTAMINKHDHLVLSTGKGHTFEEKIYWDAKKYSIFHTVRFPFRDDTGKIIGVCAVSVDISEEIELRKLQQQERDRLIHFSKLASIGVLAGEIAHEIKNPLTILKGNCMIIQSLLAENNVDGKMVGQHLETADRTITKMDQLVKSLTLLSRDSAREDFSEFQFVDLMDDVKSLCLLHRRKVQFDFSESEKGFETTVLRGNRIQISEVLLNVIAHTIESMKDTSEPQVKVTSKMEGDMLWVRVYDNGPGVPPGQEEKIFEPFYISPDNSTLGLSVSRRIMVQHHGELLYEIDKHRHCFIVKLPAVNKFSE